MERKFVISLFRFSCGRKKEDKIKSKEKGDAGIKEGGKKGEGTGSEEMKGCQGRRR